MEHNQNNSSALSTLEVAIPPIHNTDENDKSSSARSQSGDNLCGYLYKKTKDGRWQKRWFESNGNFLAYYKSKKKEKLLAALSLPQTGEIKLVSGAEFNEPGKQAKTDEEAQKWVMTLNNLKYQGPQPRASSDSQSGQKKGSKVYRDIEDVISSSTATEIEKDKKSDWRKAQRLYCSCCWWPQNNK